MDIKRMQVSNALLVALHSGEVRNCDLGFDGVQHTSGLAVSRECVLCANVL